MSLDGFTTAYSLAPLKVSPLQLLLDPTNPRLITESSQVQTYSEASLHSKETQAHILELVCRKEHGVRELISSIQEKGFMSGHQDMIVKPAGGDRYLVLEGNRRTAALQHLLAHGGRLRPDVQKSIESISVKKFIFKESSRFDEAQVIDVLLGSIHIDGPREWGALARAQYVHRSYLREFGQKRSFRYDLAMAKSVGANFRIGPKAVRKCLTIARVYEQLRRARLGAEPRHYTLIDLATKTRAVAASHFELDDDTCELSGVGVERFAALCLGEKPPVHNPKLFAAFVVVATEGSELELAQVVAGERAPDDVYDAIRTRMKRRAFREELADVRGRIAALNVNHYQGTEGEKEEIRRIKGLVDEVLIPLARGARRAS